MTCTLRIELLGGLRIEIAGEAPLRFAARRAEVFLAYLALSGRSHARETLATLLWDDREQKQALANLRSLLAQLPKRVKPYLAITRLTVALDGEAPLWIDARAFGQTLAQAAEMEAGGEATIARLEEALALYRGPFLDGVFVQESRGLEEWILVTREQLQRQAIRAHWQLATHYLHRRQYEPALPHARAVVHMDPLGERGQRLLMRLLARNGQINAALAQYEQCRRTLADELGVEPAPETEKVLRQVRRMRRPIPHELTPQLTPFVGRRAEVAAVSRLLDDPACRLLTVLGVGGAGKTRLAIQAADDVRGEYVHGIYFVPLANVRGAPTRAAEADSLVHAIADALGFDFQGQQPAQAQLLDHLRELDLLLLLDNFEHLVQEGAGLVQAILREASDVQLLITSRERLQLKAEHLLRLDGLALPSQEAGAGEAGISEAELLFQVAARRMQSDFRLAGETATAVRRICRLVEGLPLAIELAAGSLWAHEPPTIAGKIQRNLDFLSSTMRDVPARQRSLRATFDHSWALLAERLRAILAQLAVFRGEFSSEAAEAVARAKSDDLQALCARSLLRQTEAGRYSLHEALRQYAAEELAAEPQRADAARRRHSAFYGRFLLEWQDDLDGGEGQMAAVAGVNRAWDNVAAGWRWAVAQGESALLDQYLAPLNQWLTLRGLYREGLALYEQAVGALREAGGEAPALVGELLACQGFFRFRLTALEEAARDLQESVAMLSGLQQPQKTLRPLGGLASVVFRRGDYEEAGRRYREVLALSERLGLRDRMAASLEGLAIVANFQGDLPEALRLLQESLSLHREVGDRHALANVLGNLAATFMDLGRYAEAMRHYEESIAIWRELGDDYTRRIVQENMGEALLKLGQDERAREVFEETLQIGKREEYATGYSYWGLGEVHLAREAYQEAEACYRQALAQSATDYERLRALFGWARLQAKCGEAAEAAACLRLIVAHPATPELDREAAREALEEVGDGLSSPEQAEGEERSLDEVIEAILELDKS